MNLKDTSVPLYKTLCTQGTHESKKYVCFLLYKTLCTQGTPESKRYVSFLLYKTLRTQGTHESKGYFMSPAQDSYTRHLLMKKMCHLFMASPGDTKCYFCVEQFQTLWTVR